MKYDNQPDNTTIQNHNGIEYIYKVESHWDKKLKAPRNKMTYQGRWDKENGAVIKTTRKKKPVDNSLTKATTKVVGPSILLDKICKDVRLDSILKSCFPNNYKMILSTAYYTVQKGNAVSRINSWSEINQHPYGDFIANQRVSDLLKDISIDQTKEFFVKWMNTLAEEECFCYDITSVSSYSEQNEYIKFGYNRDKEKLPQINLAMLYGQKTGLPAYFRRLPGDINDVSTLQTTIKELDFLDQTKLSFVLDKGFVSESNINGMLDKHYKFILGVPNSQDWVKDIINRVKDTIYRPSNFVKVDDGDTLYMTQHMFKYNSKRCYMHIFNETILKIAD